MINAGSKGDTVDDLRAKVEQDRAELASLDRRSSAYGRLHRQIVRDSARLRERETFATQRAGAEKDLRAICVAMSVAFGIAAFASSWTFLLPAVFMLFLAWLVRRLPDHFYRV